MRHFWRVTAVHVGVLLVWVLVSGVRWLFKRREPIVVPIEFTVETSAPEPEPIAWPDEPSPEPEPKPVPDHKPEKKPVERSTRRITRTENTPPKKNRLTEEEIRKLLAKGARPSDHTSIPDEDARCFEIVRRTLYETWAQPAAADVGGTTVEAVIRLAGDGRIVGRDLKRASGDAALDRSVMDALQIVQRIEGLTPGFVERHPTVSVLFRVE